MPITKRQLEDILEVINRRYLGFTYEALGPRALTDAELTTLKRAGILRENVRHMVADPAAFGRLTAMIPLATAARISYEDLQKLVKTGGAVTGVETKAIEYATEHAAEYVKGVRDTMLRDVSAATSRARTSALRAMREGVTEALANRQTVGELKTSLYDIIDDRGRDWYRVAQTEINNAIQHGVYRRIEEEAGADQKVFKRPAPDACPYCKKLYLEDGVPKIFRMSELADTNHGLKAADWLPTIGSVHPYCRCQLSVVPEGYEFEKMNVASEKFKFESTDYKIGEIIPDDVFTRMGTDLKTKTRKEGVLKYQ